MLYGLLVLAHVVSAVVAFGTVFAMPVIRRQIDDPLVLAATQRALVRRVLHPAMTVLLLAGVTMIGVGPHSFADAWVAGSLAILLAIFGIVGAGLGRTAQATLDGTLAPADGAFRSSVLWQLTAVLAAGAFVMMVLKPG